MITETRSLNILCHLIHGVHSGFFFFFHVCVSLQDYKPEEDPCRFKSVKTGRGPLGPDWKVQYFVLNVGGDMCEATEI